MDIEKRKRNLKKQKKLSDEIKLAKINEMIAKTEQKLQRFFHENKEISNGIF